jgi:hypothetical protein
MCADGLFRDAGPKSASGRSPSISPKPVSGPRHGCSQLGDCSKEALRGFRPYLDGSGVRKPAQNVLEETPSRLLYLISVHGVRNV